MPRVAVVGGGVVGLACAWELRRRGADVVVLERGAVGAGVSRGNTGWVSPSLTYPLPAPGMVREGLRQLVDARRGVRAAAEPRSGLRALAVELPAQLQPGAVRRRRAGAARAQPPDARAVRRLPRGRDRVRDARHRARRRGAHARRARALPAHLPAPARARLHGRRRSTSSTARRSPRSSRRSARGAVAAGLHARVDRFVRPEELTAGLAARLRADGVEIREGCELRGLGAAQRRLAARRGRGAGWRRTASSWRRACRRRRSCAGWASGCRCSAPAGTASRSPAGGRRRGTRSIWPRRSSGSARSRAACGSPACSSWARARRRGRRRSASACCARRRRTWTGWRPEAGGPVEAWAGLRPATPDGLPLIGAVRDGLYLATGHGMLGVTLAPATADLLAPLVLEGRADPALAPFDPGRRM